MNNHITAIWQQYKDNFQVTEVPAKTVLLREGDISRKAYFIEEGCIRAWFNNKGKEITFQFFFEKEGVSSFDSFRKGTPSLWTLETMERSRLRWISKKDWNQIQDEILANPDAAAQYVQMLQDRQLNYMQHFMSIIRNSPKERYQSLVREKPQLIQRIPQHYIASYLGITAVSLSRIRNAAKTPAAKPRRP